MVEHGELTGGECWALSKSVTVKERVAVLLVSWCDNHRYGGVSGCRPSHAGVALALTELSVEAKFFDAHARLGLVFPICGCSRAVCWFGRGVRVHRGFRGVGWEIMFHRNTETVTGRYDYRREGMEWVILHHMASNHLTIKAPLKQSVGSLWCHLDKL